LKGFVRKDKIIELTFGDLVLKCESSECISIFGYIADIIQKLLTVPELLSIGIQKLSVSRSVSTGFSIISRIRKV